MGDAVAELERISFQSEHIADISCILRRIQAEALRENRNGRTMMGRATHSNETPTVRILVRSMLRQGRLATGKTETGCIMWSFITDVHSSSFLCSTQISTRHDAGSHLISSRVHRVYVVQELYICLQGDL